MELGKNIVKIRKDNNLTQDELAEKYFVTRQTISNWEIGKSYPDLETLVKISNDFNVSLDVLLKEDNKMIKEIDNKVKGARKYKSILKYIIIFVSLLIILFSIYMIMYYNLKKNTIDRFNDIASKYNFKNNGSGIYSLDYDDNIYCSVIKYFPKLLDFKLDYEKDNSLFCTIVTGENLKYNDGDGTGWSSEVQVNFTNDEKLVIESFTCEDKNNFSTGLFDKNGNECDYYARTNHYRINNDEISIANIDFDTLSEKLNVDKELLQKTVTHGFKMYKDLYK